MDKIHVKPLFCLFFFCFCRFFVQGCSCFGISCRRRRQIQSMFKSRLWYYAQAKI